MRLVLHTVICCCVITTVLPVLVKGATGDISLKKRIRAWLQNHMKTDLHNSLGRAKEQLPDNPLRPQQGGLMNIVSPTSSFSLKIRSRRSASSKPSGCLLFTCAFQDLLHRLHNIKGRQKMASAPEKKISSKGYGRRRRRSLQDLTQSNFQIERQNTEDDLPLCSYEICTEA